MKSLVDTFKKRTGTADFSAAPVMRSFFCVGDKTFSADRKGTDFLTVFAEESSVQTCSDFFHRHLPNILGQAHLDGLSAVVDNDKVETRLKESLSCHPRESFGRSAEYDRVGQFKGLFRHYYILQEQGIFI